MAEGSSDLSLAGQRLEKALAALEGRVRSLSAKGASGSNGHTHPGQMSAREKALEAAAIEASQALGRAAVEMRAALAAAADREEH